VHTKHDLKVHLVWLPKYRKKVLIGPVAIRVRDLIRQIAMEHDIQTLSSKSVMRPYSRVHLLSSPSANQQNRAVVEGDEFTCTPSRISSFRVLGC
jgi:putative transposase